MKKFICIILAAICVLGITLGITRAQTKQDVVIFVALEDFRVAQLKDKLKDKFPNKKIDIQYYPSGNLATKVKAEGLYIDADIVVDIDYGNMERLKTYFEKSDKLDYEIFEKDLRGPNDLYVPISKFSVGMVVNTEILTRLGLPEPQSYQSLISEKYKKTFMMPNPKASGTGYAFLMGMVNALGEEQAFDYFSTFAKNTMQFTSSGSGPINALSRGECAIGIGMLFQAVQQINGGGGRSKLFIRRRAFLTTSAGLR